MGQRVRVWLGDGTERTLRIAAVMATGTGDNGVYVTPANAPGARVDRVDVALTAGADARAVAAGLERAVRPVGGRVGTGEHWASAKDPGSERTTRYGFLLVLGIALLYTGISVANTMVMAVSGRVREFAALRLAGATRWQVLRMAGAEALTVVAFGAVLGLAVAVLNLAVIRGALNLLSAPATITVPWPALAVVTAACAALSTTAAVIPTALALRHPALSSAAVRE
ncbi:hypothetical protein SHKM778_00410 [Streptomyces sp. KM77-8]|uniref:ABC3 transporter permease C-terminal domain-containing protein n=1 Tax=Streptomyces haneummycinicus TaxID=3074435 RepID=A0AAT9H8I0_9ACTN